MELATVRSSQPLALIVIGSCAEVREYGGLAEMSLVVFDPFTKKYEERGARQRVTCIQVGSQSVNRRKESVDAQMPDGHTTECTIDVLEDFAPVELWEAILLNQYKAVTTSFLRLDPELQILAKYGRRVPSVRDLKETKDTSRVGEIRSIQVVTWHPISQKAQVMKISGQQQSGIFTQHTMKKQLEATVVPVERSSENSSETADPVCLACENLRSGFGERKMIGSLWATDMWYTHFFG